MSSLFGDNEGTPIAGSDDLEWEIDANPTVTTWASNRPRRTFAARRKQPPLARANSKARKVLMPDTPDSHSRQSPTETLSKEPLNRRQSSASSSSSSSLRPKFSRSLTLSNLEESSARRNSDKMDSSPEFGAPPVLERKSRLMPRASTLPPTMPSKSPRFPRSRSLALGTPTQNRSFREQFEDLRALEEEQVPWGLAENEHPNQTEDLFQSDISRGRKKHRVRRASIQGTVPSISDLSTLFQKHAPKDSIDSSGTPPIPPPPGGLHMRSSSSPTKVSNRNNLDLIEYPMSTSSPASSSKTNSSRKRGVCGSPISDIMDDHSTGAMSASINSNSSISMRRSQRRVFSPEMVPVPASLDPPLAFKSLSTSNPKTLSHNHFRGADASEDSEDEDDGHHSVDSALDDSEDDGHPVPVLSIPTTQEQKGEIFDRMSSYDDLKFLIKALRKEACGQHLSGNNGSWTVALPTAWHSSRRADFLHWTLSDFQFAIRPLGNSVNVLQISKTSGQKVLEQLEEALIAYKEKTCIQQVSAKTLAPETPFGAMAPKAPSPAQSQGMTPFKITGTIMEDGAVELTAGFQALSVNPSSKPSRHSEESFPGTGLFHGDTSLSRPSFESSVVGSSDMMLHLHGHCSPLEKPMEDVIRPAKMSMESVASTVSRGRLSAPHAPIQTFEIMETPQIKQDEGWGSRPIPGKDFGSSQSCGDDILDVLSQRFEAACVASGVRDSIGTTNSGGLPVMPGGLDLDEYDETESPEDAQDEIIEEELEVDGKQARRLRVSFAKHKRISLWATASQDGVPLLPSRKSAFAKGRPSLGTLEEFTSLHEYEDSFPIREASICEVAPQSCHEQLGEEESILVNVFSYLTESELLCKASLVSSTWASAATTAHAALMMASVGYIDDMDWDRADFDEEMVGSIQRSSVSLSMDRPWSYLTQSFPWACFLSSGAFKRVFKVYNARAGGEEALSVMDVDMITDKKTIAAELVVSAMLSSLARRAICPNFVITRGVFTMPFDVPESHWGNEKKKKPKGSQYQAEKRLARPRQPKESFPGRFQFIRMELCSEGDFEEYLKRQESESLHKSVARSSLFQIAFALHAAADRYSLKHYDIKLLNVFIQQVEAETPSVVLRYGLGSHVYALDIPSEFAFFAKLADYGTANIQVESTGQPVTIAQFSTLENTPPDYMILGDEARQGHGHDNFGLGLSMLHLFTGHAPYEEILEEVVCPPMLKKKLRAIWENDNVETYSVIRSVILSDVYKDERGHILEGEPDETLYDTLYRFLVLFGIPGVKFDQRKCPLVWKAITEALETKCSRRRMQGTDIAQYERDCEKYSVMYGSNYHIARARESLESMPGGMELLFDLCSFDPTSRATSLQVLNSTFMEDLREEAGCRYSADQTVHSFTAFSTSAISI